MIAAKKNRELADIISFEVINGMGQIAKGKKFDDDSQENPRLVDPIKSKFDVNRCIDYLRAKVSIAKRKDSKFVASRNLLLFIIGINVGFRVSDLQRLRWSHFFMQDMKTFRGATNKKEKKTGKSRLVCINSAVQNAILEFLKETGIEPAYNDYVFISTTTKTHITEAPVEKMMKDLQKNLSLEGNFNTHSVRKTYAYQKYMMLVERNDPMALVKVQVDLGHRNSSDTARYLGITRQDSIDSSYELGYYWDE